MAILLAALTGCAAGRASEQEELERIARRHSSELLAFHDAQNELRLHTYLPQRRDFGAEGTVIVRQCYLGGRLGDEKLRVRFTYVNTTDRPVRAARVRLTLRDPESKAEWYESLDLIPPFTFELSPGSTYSSWFAMPTQGVHRHASWSWDIGLDALETNEL
jgi:hypothetical protein